MNHAIEHGLYPHNDEDHLVEFNHDDIQDGLLKLAKFPEGFCIAKKCQRVEEKNMKKAIACKEN